MSQMVIPEGFAHEFLTLSQTSEFLYKTTVAYSAKDEECIIWNDDFLKNCMATSFAYKCFS